MRKEPRLEGTMFLGELGSVRDLETAACCCFEPEDSDKMIGFLGGTIGGDFE